MWSLEMGRGWQRATGGHCDGSCKSGNAMSEHSFIYLLICFWFCFLNKLPNSVSEEWFIGMLAVILHFSVFFENTPVGSHDHV